MDYESMTIEDIEAKLIEMSNQRTAIRQEMLRAKQIMDAKIIARDANLPAQVVGIEPNQIQGRTPE